MPKFKVNDIVRVHLFPYKHRNAFGRVAYVEKVDGGYLYRVSNGNQPFQGTLCGHLFTENELSLKR